MPNPVSTDQNMKLSKFKCSNLADAIAEPELKHQVDAFRYDHFDEGALIDRLRDQFPKCPLFISKRGDWINESYPALAAAVERGLVRVGL